LADHSLLLRKLNCGESSGFIEALILHVRLAQNANGAFLCEWQQAVQPARVIFWFGDITLAVAVG